MEVMSILIPFLLVVCVTRVFFKMCVMWWDLPEAMKHKAIEADKLFRRGCLQYLEDVGLSTERTE